MTLSTYFYQFIKGISSFITAYDFAKKHRIWAGLFKNKWISIVLCLVIFFVAYHSIYAVLGFFQGTLIDHETGVQQAGFFSGLGLLSHELFFSSSIKYIVLIALEVITFHCSTKTINLLTGRNFEPSFNDFYKAEIRMIKVAIRSWIYELIATILITIIFEIFGLGWLKYPFIYFAQFFFVGLAFLDNYLEQFKIDIKDSFAIIYQHVGASVAIGMLSLSLVFIPIIGPVVGPILGAVSAAIYFHYENVAIDYIESMKLMEKAE